MATMLNSGLVSWVILALGIGLLMGLLTLRMTTTLRSRSYELGPVVTVLFTAALSPFVMAFAAKLGERLGTAVRIERVPWRHRRRRRGELVVAPARAHGRTITLEVGAGMSDEARLALIDLDVDRPELWGHRLRWDEDAKAWLPIPERPESEAND